MKDILQRDKHFAIVGLGKTGYSCVRYLASKGYTLSVTDSRKIPPYLLACREFFPNIPVFCGGISEQLLNDADDIIVSPGIPLTTKEIVIAASNGKSIYGDIEIFSHEAKKPLIAISGSNGKTTITTLVGEMIKRSGLQVGIGGNIGVPALDLLLQPTPDYYVLEISSFQLETTYSLSPHIACVVNVCPDHLDRYSSYEKYIDAKRRIYKHCDVAIINLDQDIIWRDLPLLKTISFSLNKVADFHLLNRQDTLYLAQHNQPILSVNELKLSGRHYWQNMLCVLAIGHVLGLARDVMIDVLISFQGLKHRYQWVRRLGGVDWYNDSKATNIGAAECAIMSLGQSCSGKILLIAGGQVKESDFTKLQRAVEAYVTHAILFGQDAMILEMALKDRTQVIRVTDLEAAVAMAHCNAQSGDAVLFSPACASFDMFSNYAERGDCFIQAVNNL